MDATLFAHTLGLKAVKHKGTNGRIIACLTIDATEKNGAHAQVTLHMDPHLLDALVRTHNIPLNDSTEEA
ncbi:MAG: hypothetical protein RBS36_04295 [Thiomicrospira sp.]|jgi:hypothetical protein|nr:hypothetical protein [Thiomicrospira sp.]